MSQFFSIVLVFLVFSVVCTKKGLSQPRGPGMVIKKISIICSHPTTMSTNAPDINFQPQHNDHTVIQNVSTTPPVKIWTTAEKTTLTQHLEEYKNLNRKAKSLLLQSRVIPMIKELWKTQYSKQACEEDRDRKKEWKQKKKIFLNLFIPYYQLKVTF